MEIFIDYKYVLRKIDVCQRFIDFESRIKIVAVQVQNSITSGRHCL